MSAGRRAYTVSQVNSYIAKLVGTEPFLRNLTIAGEIGECKYHSSGHIYFSVKDGGSVLSCIMFASDREGLKVRLETGLKVLMRGSVRIYERGGTYSFHARKIEKDGEGELYLKFLETKKRLEGMGLFDSAHKKPIPAYAFNIGIATSAGGAAIRDIARVASRRNPYVQLTVADTLVQGDLAPANIAMALRRLDLMNPDVIILARGGGSERDLWAFNDEIVARAIYECRTPVISAIGHETDNTIADLVADLRAATPSVAAELAVFEANEYLDMVSGMENRLVMAARSCVSTVRLAVEGAYSRLRAQAPAYRLSQNRTELEGMAKDIAIAMSKTMLQARTRLDAAKGDIDGAMDICLSDTKNAVAIAAVRLDGLSPLRKLSQGYAYVTDGDGRNIRSVTQVEPGDTIGAMLSDGTMTATVTGLEHIKNGMSDKKGR